jgi:hypothetical protein
MVTLRDDASDGEDGREDVDVDVDEKGSAHCVNALGGRASKVRTSMVAIALSGRGVVTLTDYTRDGENRKEGEDEKKIAHSVDVLFRLVVVRARRCG